jgi:hypothetical protein
VAFCSILLEGRYLIFNLTCVFYWAFVFGNYSILTAFEAFPFMKCASFLPSYHQYVFSKTLFSMST